MNQPILFHGSPTTSHLQTCRLHEDNRLWTCTATLRTGRRCPKKATATPMPGFMPVCKPHRMRLKKSTHCRALLSCNFECGRICEWRLREYQLCLDHIDSEHQMPCFFLKIPVEARLRIYGFLLPDKAIPARKHVLGNVNLGDLREDRGRIYIAIMLVNRQIHDEAAGLLYSTRSFAIELCRNMLTTCNFYKVNWSMGREIRMRYHFRDPVPAPLHDYQHHIIHNYGIQGTIVKQQQLKLLAMAKQAQSNMNRFSNTEYLDLLFKEDPSPQPPISLTNGDNEPMWNPSLSERYFNLIRLFRIDIVLPSRKDDGSLPPTTPKEDEANRNARKSDIYDCCDQIHKLIGRLRLRTARQPISRLEITVNFNGAYSKRDEAFYDAMTLLRPFRRLCHVVKPELLSVKMSDPPGIIDLLNPSWTPSPDTKGLSDFFEGLCKESSPAQDSLVFKAYWQLERLTSRIKEHYPQVDAKLETLRALQRVARVARENDDLPAFLCIWGKVLNVWYEHLNQQKEFESNVAVEIEAICNVVKDGS